MMNHSLGPHHKMWTPGATPPKVSPALRKRLVRRQEQGYTLVALLAMMTILALFALAAAPAIRQQAQREREIETIFRGEQVADAIRIYYSYQVTRGRAGVNALPTSTDQLLEGISVGTKKVQILRPSAARDPLSDSGEWSLVQPRSAQLADFTRSIMLFAQNIRPPTNDQQLQRVEQDMAPPVIPTGGLPPSGQSSSEDSNSSGPFIGVRPNTTSASILNYYGIDRHEGWVFTPLFR